MLKYIDSDLSIGKEAHQPSYAMSEMHYHNTNELYYLQKGSCSYSIEKNLYKIKAGTFVIIPAGVEHKTTYLSDSSHERIVIDFSNQEAEWFEKEVGHSTLDALYSKKIIKVPAQKINFVNEMLEKMFYEQNGVDELSGTYKKAYFYQIILFIIRCEKYQENVVTKMNISNNFIQKIVEYICSHYHSDITLGAVANEFHISESCLSKKFKAFTGFRFKEYLIKVRLHASEEYLLNTNKSITEIADLCGFSNANAFGDSFKKFVGISPREYRKRN